MKEIPSLLYELSRAKAAFQQKTLIAILTDGMSRPELIKNVEVTE